MTYDVLTFIGRFGPFHAGHKSVVDQALQESKKVAIVIGSDQQPRTARNPFTTQERIDMITMCFPEEVAQGRIHFAPQVDHTYAMDRWIAGVQSSVSSISQKPFNPDPVTLGLIGHSKDASSFYLKSFPTWDSVEVPNYRGVNATDIRAVLFTTGVPENTVGTVFSFVPEPVQEWLRDWQKTDAFFEVKEEFDFIQRYKAEWEAAPYPPTFYTADAVVVQAGHVLLVKRKLAPGKGLWAMPGGFVNQDENSREAAVRELYEETKIKVPKKVLSGSIRSWRLFEDPYRSQRGRTITMAYKFELPDSAELPKVKGTDDAEKAQWVPIANLTREAMFEDHYDILSNMVPF